MATISHDDFVRLFQERYGLRVDGIAGAATVAKVPAPAPLKLPLDDDDFTRFFQRAHGLTADGWAGRDTIAKLDMLVPPKAIDAPTGVIPDAYWPMLARIESGGQPYVQAPSSSASGLYQFIKSTWQAEGGAWGRALRPAFGGLRPSVDEQTARAKTFTAKNAAYLKARGIPINKASLYAAHFFGPLTAAAVIAAPLDASAEAIAGIAATKANPSILKGKTVAQFLSWLKGKTGEMAK